MRLPSHTITLGAIFLSTLLTTILFLSGNSPTTLPSFSILSLNITGLKAEYLEDNGVVLPIRDVYSLYPTTVCAGWYNDYTAGDNEAVRFQCSEPRDNNPFLPIDLLSSDLQYNNFTDFPELDIPTMIQTIFTDMLNSQLYATFVLYILSIVFGGISAFTILLAKVRKTNPEEQGWKKVLGWLAILTEITDDFSVLFLLIGSALLTNAQIVATSVINETATAFGILAYHNGNLLALTWCATVIRLLSTISRWSSNLRHTVVRHKLDGVTQTKVDVEKGVAGSGESAISAGSTGMTRAFRLSVLSSQSQKNGPERSSSRSSSRTSIETGTRQDVDDTFSDGRSSVATWWDEGWQDGESSTGPGRRNSKKSTHPRY